jgi:tRNA threonylcarbamoyladenosine biosynthesis protein TsaB
MKLLSLDTSTKKFSLAISDGNKFLAARTMVNDRVLSSKIIPALDKLFVKAGIALKDIDAIAVGLGPGSFTSLRVGLSTVKGLAYALDKPIIGIPSMDAAAMNAKKGSVDQVCTFFDAKRGLVYTAVYQCLGGGLDRVSEYMLVEPLKVLAMLKGAVAFVGDAIPLYKDLINEKSKLKTAKFTPVFLDEKKWFPSAKNLSLIARERFEYKDFDHIDTLVPLYLYPEDCQVRKITG